MNKGLRDFFMMSEKFRNLAAILFSVKMRKARLLIIVFVCLALSGVANAIPFFNAIKGDK